MATAVLDGTLFARADSVKPPTIPDPHDVDAIEIAIRDLQTILITQPAVGYSLWHAITNFPQLAYQYVQDTQTGKVYQIYIGDTITVKYSDGWTEKFQFLGTGGGTLQWKEVSGSLRDPNGNPPPANPAPPTSSNTTPVPGGGFTFPWPDLGDISLLPILPNDNGGPSGVISILPVPGSDIICYEFVGPC
jgi:hypothetical protein